MCLYYLPNCHVLNKAGDFGWGKGETAVLLERFVAYNILH